MRPLVLAILLALAAAAPAQGHSVSQAWAERQAEHAAYVWADAGDTYAWDVQQGLRPVRVRNQRHHHGWMVLAGKITEDKSRACVKRLAVRWVLFEARLSRAWAHKCYDPLDRFPDQIDELSPGEILGHYMEDWDQYQN